MTNLGEKPVNETWYIASKPRATFGFSVVNGKVDKCAPIGRRWMKGRPIEEVLPRLKRNGYEVSQCA